MTTPEEETLVEATLSAHRDRDLEGNLRFHPAFHDLDDAGRRRAYEAALRARAERIVANVNAARA